jgi:hypothetical protein
VRLRAHEAIARIVGTAASLGVLVLWALFLFRNPYAPAAEGRVLLFGCLMMVAAAVAAVASALGAHLAMYLLFVVSFFPVGLYVMLGPGIFAAIGWLDLLYLLSAIGVHRAILTSKKENAWAQPTRDR